jgi:ubiquinone/menaquinone biosynthesis C-methylase UbiE
MRSDLPCSVVWLAGKAYGLNMTDEMLDLVRRNAPKPRRATSSFLKGHIEGILLPDGSVDVVIAPADGLTNVEM